MSDLSDTEGRVLKGTKDKASAQSMIDRDAVTTHKFHKTSKITFLLAHI